MTHRPLAALLAGTVLAAGCGRSPAPDLLTPPAPAVAAVPAANFDQSFAEATTVGNPDGVNLPPARTVAGKPTTAVYAAVRAAWPTVKVLDENGNPAPIPVTVDTDLGPVEMVLFPDAAPNHVRNFLALARVGYYDGLRFERTFREEIVADGDIPGGSIELVTAGCPSGDGAVGGGHVGYFLRPEETDLRHEVGTVGFWRDRDPASAGTRFYVCLAANPTLDERFTPIGKVTAGLDTVRAIAARPVKDANSYPENEQPREPVGIRGVRRR